jgi:site-specific recombinase XerD
MARRSASNLESLAAAPDLRLLEESLARALRASNRSPRTVRSYGDAVRLLTDFLHDSGMPTAAAHVHREHVEAFIEEQLSRRKPATAANRFRSLQQFFKFCVDEGEIPESPMARMKPPKVPDPVTPVLTEGEQARLLKSCAGASFEPTRSGHHDGLHRHRRLSEVANLRYDPSEPTKNDVDLDVGLIRVVGKGGRERPAPIGAKTVRALDRYLRTRPRHDRSPTWRDGSTASGTRIVAPYR